MLHSECQIKKNRNKIHYSIFKYSNCPHFMLLNIYLDKMIPPCYYVSDGREAEILMMEVIKFHKT